MNLLKDWTICICVTLIIATIFSLVTPDGRIGKFYKVLISLFVFLSFIYPLKDSSINYNIQNYYPTIKSSYNNDCVISNLIEAEIKNKLADNNVNNSSVTVVATQIDNDIEIKSVSVAITDEYEVNKVKELIFKEIGINAEVHKLGD